MFEAPTPLAPVNATTLSDWLTGAPKTEVTDCVLVTVTPVSTAGAVAVQISATPLCAAGRSRRAQGGPAPARVGVGVWVPGGGPTGGARASASPPAALVEKAGVV